MFVAFATISAIAVNSFSAVQTESGETEKKSAKSDPAAGKDDGGSKDKESENRKQKPTLLRMLFDGNIFGVMVVGLILILSVVATYFIIEHAITITRGKLMPEHVLSDLEQHISRGEIIQAIDICHRKENYSLTTEVILAGLE